jgi:hypothetical protein
LLPYADLLVVAGAGALSIALAFRRMGGDGLDLLWNCTLVQMYFLMAGCLLNSLQSGRLDLSFGVEGWGLFFLFFGALAMWQGAACDRVGSPRSG